MSGLAGDALLAVDAITKRFGGLVALDDVSFVCRRASIVGLIGPNGSGKTTLLNVVNGIYVPDAGTICISGVSTAGRRPSSLASSGISRTFQTARVFQTLTVRQNLFIPLLHHGQMARAAAMSRADELLAFVGLADLADHTASALSGGQQRLLEFARALVTQPTFVLMDEPFAGVHPAIKSQLIRCIRETVARESTSFLIVSHEVPDLVGMADFMLCLVEGRVAASGAPADVVCNETVIEGYLGRA